MTRRSRRLLPFTLSMVRHCACIGLALAGLIATTGCGGGGSSSDDRVAAATPPSGDVREQDIERLQQIVSATEFAGDTAAATSGATGKAASEKPRRNLDDVPVPTLSWAPCGARYPDRDCASPDVPLDYGAPFGETIRLAMARYAARSPAGRIGTVFVNPGGPGGSGIELVGSSFGPFLHDLLGGRFDIVAIDPRGVGFSEPLQCFDSAETRQAFLKAFEQLGTPVARSAERPYFDASQALTDRCLSRPQKITRHMSTADVVRDMELMRRAVGDAKLSYLGFSYGSHIGNTYANLFPDKVRAVVIDGVLNPLLWTEGLQIVSDRKAALEVAREFLRLCDEAGVTACALAGAGGASARYDRTVAALRRQPIGLPNGTQVAYNDVINETISGLYSPELWGGPIGTGALLGAIAGAVESVPGAREQIVRILEARAAQQPQRAPRDLAEPPYENGFEAYWGNHCSDAQYPRRFDTWSAVGSYAAAGSIFGPTFWWQNAPCATWPLSKDRYAGPWFTTTSSPVLVVGNFFDPSTDYNGAVASNKLLSNSRLLSYAGWGHVAFGRSACVTQATARYLTSGELPPQGTVCPANPNPFLPTTDAADKDGAAKAGDVSSMKPAADAMALIGKPSPVSGAKPMGGPRR
jgi:pimeloyl-ACP methyl ester carboxylesterase